MLIYYLNLIACICAGPVRGEWKAWTAHLVGSKKCLYATEVARECVRKANQPIVPDTTKHTRSSSMIDASDQSQKCVKSSQLSIRPYTNKPNDLPFNPAEQALVQAQALHAIISTNLAFSLFEDPEMYGVDHLDTTTYVQWLCTRQFESPKNQSLTLTLVSAQHSDGCLFSEFLAHIS